MSSASARQPHPDPAGHAFLRPGSLDATLDEAIENVVRARLAAWDRYRASMLDQAARTPYHWAHSHDWGRERLAVARVAYRHTPECVEVHLPPFDLTPELVDTLLATSADT